MILLGDWNTFLIYRCILDKKSLIKKTMPKFLALLTITLFSSTISHASALMEAPEMLSRHSSSCRFCSANYETAYYKTLEEMILKRDLSPVDYNVLHACGYVWPNEYRYIQFFILNKLTRIYRSNTEKLTELHDTFAQKVREESKLKDWEVNLFLRLCPKATPTDLLSAADHMIENNERKLALLIFQRVFTDHSLNIDQLYYV